MQVLRNVCLGFLVFCALQVAPLRAAGEDRKAEIREFLTVTGFDVALDSIRLSAGDAPQMIGLDQSVFGTQWKTLTEEVFEPGLMLDMAVGILRETLRPEVLQFGAEFYASDLGQRLVLAENTAHKLEDDSVQKEAGSEIVAALVAHSSPRLRSYQRMLAAIDTAGASVRAINEIQLRFLMAAAGAGLIELQLDEGDLRTMLAVQEADMLRRILAASMASAAYTYQAFSDEDVARYAEVLEDPRMKELYELMGAVQYEVMANRFVALAHRMAEIPPATEL